MNAFNTRLKLGPSFTTNWVELRVSTELKTDFKGVGISDETLRGAFVIVFEMNNIS